MDNYSVVQRLTVLEISVIAALKLGKSFLCSEIPGVSKYQKLGNIQRRSTYYWLIFWCSTRRQIINHEMHVVGANEQSVCLWDTKNCLFMPYVISFVLREWNFKLAMIIYEDVFWVFGSFDIGKKIAIWSKAGKRSSDATVLKFNVFWQTQGRYLPIDTIFLSFALGSYYQYFCHIFALEVWKGGSLEHFFKFLSVSITIDFTCLIQLFWESYDVVLILVKVICEDC